LKTVAAAASFVSHRVAVAFVSNIAVRQRQILSRNEHLW
jgi:hypothetical protein